MNKSIAIKYHLIPMLLGIILIMGIINYLHFTLAKEMTIPTVIRQSFEEELNIVEVGDLLKIVYALNRYKIDHSSYPPSSNGIRAWDGFKSDFGESRIDWIRELAPTYINALPRDPRMLDNGKQQYLYMSNGANYKLIAYHPSNCEQVRKLYPSMIDPKRGCQAFGFWTDRAIDW